MIDRLKPACIRAGSGIEKSPCGAYECFGPRCIESEIPRKAKVGESIPIVRTALCCGVFRIAQKKCAHSGFVREDRCGVNAGGGNLRIFHHMSISACSSNRSGRKVARNASHVNEGCGGIREGSDGTNQVESFNVI